MVYPRHAGRAVCTHLVDERPKCVCPNEIVVKINIFFCKDREPVTPAIFTPRRRFLIGPYTFTAAIIRNKESDGAANFTCLFRHNAVVI